MRDLRLGCPVPKVRPDSRIIDEGTAQMANSPAARSATRRESRRRSRRDSLQSLVRSVGLEVHSFGSAREFLQSKRPDAPGCLVLDVRLPGESGLDLQHELARSNIHLPIIFITGYGD